MCVIYFKYKVYTVPSQLCQGSSFSHQYCSLIVLINTVNKIIACVSHFDHWGSLKPHNIFQLLSKLLLTFRFQNLGELYYKCCDLISYLCVELLTVSVKLKF